ncbi:MAG: adenosylhomocysteinase [Crenarchaeota archaeon]|nr:adenosylhomocysteinase [Thermoproteota archaeon]MCR8453467.1 adenosylhomocysteinase [Thermoproteota archaeon]MCR8454888.1 adenosylhomocysteinase [Thermoproteota archaeon]MCR8462774.1 adenosylhomocysteinase [Thermoproteota archaeon]MCR8470531.1 adenosylhomocysteinase [Thermoproteota archaeon]
MTKHKIKSIDLAEDGQKRILWAQSLMPTLKLIGEDFSKTKPLKGLKIGACLHVTKETANLMIALKNAGAEVFLCGSNPLSTQDDVAAALVKYHEVSVFAWRGETEDEYKEMLRRVIESEPNIVIDDGGDLIVMLHEEYKDLAKDILGGAEETTTGVLREKSLERDRRLLFPVIATNDATIKRLVDNKFGTGQSTIDGILRATSILLAGKTAVVAGYGYVGRGIAQRLRGLGARVIITEVDPIKALEAHYDGFQVMPMDEAAELGDIFITATGNIDIIRKEHLLKMKNGAILCNAGHFDVEINLKDLREISTGTEKINYCVEKYSLENGRYVYLLGCGRLVNLVCGEGHPPEVMDISFSLQALVARYIANNYDKLEKRIYQVPYEIEEEVAMYKLKALGIKLDELTPRQREYLKSWK